MPDNTPILDLRKLGVDASGSGGVLLVIAGRIGSVDTYNIDGNSFSRAKVAMFGQTVTLKFPGEGDPTYQRLLNMKHGEPVLVLQPCAFDAKKGVIKIQEVSETGATAQLLEAPKASA